MHLSRYWTLHAINGLCQHQALSLEQIQCFLEHQTFEIQTDRHYQAQLVKQAALADAVNLMAHISLRCFVSAIIFFECLEKAKKFGTHHQFTPEDLLPLVMDPRPPCSDLNRYQIPRAEVSLTTRILDKFEPEKANLSTYTKLCVKGCSDLKVFLLGQGVSEVTDWYLLCDRTPSGLSRILREYPFPRSTFAAESTGLEDGAASHYFHTPEEVRAAVDLLECFHQVYKQQRLQAQTRQQPYPSPSPQQLEEMGHRLSRSQQAIFHDLKALAKTLRHYVISLSKFQAQPRLDPETNADDESKWLHQHLLPYLQLAVEQVVSHRYHFHKKAKKRTQYKQALGLFFGQSTPMGDIASELGISQPSVSRLLDLKTLREDVGVEILVQAPRDLLTQLHPCYTPAELEQFNAYLEAFLQSMMAADVSQAFTSRNREINSPLAQAICQTLSTLER